MTRPAAAAAAAVDSWRRFHPFAGVKEYSVSPAPHSDDSEWTVPP